MVLIVTSQVAATEISSDSLKHFPAPFFVMYLHTDEVLVLWRSLHRALCSCCGRSSAKAQYALLQHSQTKTKRSQYVQIALIFYPLWVCANYAFALSYERIAPSITNAVFASCTAFVSIFSAILLPHDGERFFTPARMLSVALAVGGVIAISLGGKSSSDEGTKSPLAGVLLRCYHRSLQPCTRYF